MIEVILKEPVDHLGGRGDVVKVADGFARNYLLPRKLALQVTAGNQRQIDAEKKRAADMTDDEREAAKAQRRNVIESNKAWKAATTVRRDWLSAFAQRKTAPAGAEAYLARVITEGWGHERADTGDRAQGGQQGASGATGDRRAGFGQQIAHGQPGPHHAGATFVSERSLSVPSWMSMIRSA